MSNRGPPIRGNTLFWHLKKNGPSKMPDSNPGYKPSDRHRYDIRRLNTHGRNRGRLSSKAGGKPEAIYYLGQYHDKEQVLRAWLEENESVFNGGGFEIHQISIKLPTGFMDIWNDIRGEYEDWFRTRESNSGGSQKSKYDECPVCEQDLNEENTSALAEHLPDCPGP